MGHVHHRGLVAARRRPEVRGQVETGGSGHLGRRAEPARADVVDPVRAAGGRRDGLDRRGTVGDVHEVQGGAEPGGRRRGEEPAAGDGVRHLAGTLTIDR